MFAFGRHRIAPLVGAAVAALVLSEWCAQRAQAADIFILGRFFASPSSNQVELVLELDGEIDAFGRIRADGIVAYTGHEGADQVLADGRTFPGGVLMLDLFRNEFETAGFAHVVIYSTGEAFIEVELLPGVPGGPVNVLYGVAIVNIRKDRGGVIEPL